MNTSCAVSECIVLYFSIIFFIYTCSEELQYSCWSFFYTIYSRTFEQHIPSGKNLKCLDFKLKLFIYFLSIIIIVNIVYLGRKKKQVLYELFFSVFCVISHECRQYAFRIDTRRCIKYVLKAEKSNSNFQ